MDSKGKTIPLRAVIGGVDSSGEKVYVGRIKKDGTLLPGKVVPSHNCCYAAYDGAECGSSKFQVKFVLSTEISAILSKYLIRICGSVNRF